VVSAGPSGPAGTTGTVVAASAGTVAGTEPYPWPWDGRLSPRRCALLVVGDRSPIGDPDVERIVRELTAGAVAVGVMAIQVITGRPVADGSTVVRGSAADWSVGPSVTAAGWDGFYGSPLDALLRAAGRDQLLLVGRLLETGVHSTLRSANDQGYECLTVTDACEAAGDATRLGGLSSITMSGGIFGAIGSSSAVLSALGVPPTPFNSTESTDSIDSTDSTEES
jgi:biuret amidohydrolase